MAEAQDYVVTIAEDPRGPHPFDILAAPTAEEGVRIGFELASGYRALLIAALDLIRHEQQQALMARQQLHRAITENRALRAAAKERV